MRWLAVLLRGLRAGSGGKASWKMIGLALKKPFIPPLFSNLPDKNSWRTFPVCCRPIADCRPASRSESAQLRHDECPGSQCADLIFLCLCIRRCQCSAPVFAVDETSVAVGL